ncbi:MAG TPA: molecular chaperone TorD [Deferribacteraceae bacterium]|jgi:anaerobic sulfite reductase subunit A|nr:molecular chaperone TorD [Deferribacteraceae bacterium]
MSELTVYSSITEERENMYMLLATLYKTEVTPELYDMIKNVRFSEEKELRTGYEKMHDFVSVKRHDPITDLAVDYARIFLGAGVVETEQSAFPYESVYTSDKRLIMQEARDEVLYIYRKHGLGVDDKYNIPEDHLALELEFMAYLCSSLKQKIDKDSPEEVVSNLDEQKSFINKHLANWVPSFCNDVKKVAGTEFYIGLAELTTAFLTMDLNIIDGLLVQLNQKARI